MGEKKPDTEQKAAEPRPKMNVGAERAAGPTAGAKPKPPGYRTGKWAGLEHYACEGCKYSTTNKAAIEKHVRAPHRPREE